MAAFSSSFQLLESMVFLPNRAFGTLQNVDQGTIISANIGTSNNRALITTYKNSCSMQSNIPMDKKRKRNQASFAISYQSKEDMREVKGNKRQKEMKNITSHEKEEVKAAGYVHVRCRRGQATDRHSLAERLRRERISERMKILQALVPGCHKVAGKALMLDEIINYVQSLQNQVEFLSMRLASVNPMFHDFGMDLESPVRPNEDSNSFQSLMSSLLLDNSAKCHLLQDAQMPNTYPAEGHRQGLWEVDDQRQQIISQSEISKALFSQH
ncbi:hypothetical protein CASFOL_000857 [Castilleja foliolosa]|uniref:BHLH domain-containing protein n=1 Tax=Castilleja foliolosa TaxID=1961234 RepID=A0ABD3ELF2_9LAMI